MAECDVDAGGANVAAVDVVDEGVMLEMDDRTLAPTAGGALGEGESASSNSSSARPLGGDLAAGRDTVALSLKDDANDNVWIERLRGGLCFLPVCSNKEVHVQGVPGGCTSNWRAVCTRGILEAHGGAVRISMYKHSTPRASLVTTSDRQGAAFTTNIACCYQCKIVVMTPMRHPRRRVWKIKTEAKETRESREGTERAGAHL